MNQWQVKKSWHLDTGCREGGDGLGDPLLQAVLHSCGPQQGEVGLYGLCLSCHGLLPALQRYTGLMVTGTPQLHTKTHTRTT